MSFWIMVMLLVVSFAANLLGLWYIKQLLNSFRYLGETFGSYSSSLDEYTEHIQKVLEMDLYYDEPVLKSLLSHTEDIAKATQNYQEGFSLDD